MPKIYHTNNLQTHNRLKLAYSKKSKPIHPEESKILYI